MDVNMEIDTEGPSNISIGPKISLTSHFTDFLTQSDDDDISNEEEVESMSEDDEDLETFVSMSFPNIVKTNVRERQISITESEDSFIAFEGGPAGESESSEESGSESEDDIEFADNERQDQEDGDDEVDFSSRVFSTKKVRFAADSKLCEVHTMIQWSFAYQQARKGPWEEYARDRDRFNRRLLETGNILEPVFEAAHREKVYHQRFTDDTVSK